MRTVARWFRQVFPWLLGLGAVVASSFAVPWSVRLSAPQKARLVSAPAGMKVDCFVMWGGFALQEQWYQDQLTFVAPGDATFPPYAIPTTAGMAARRWLLPNLGKKYFCQHCYGPDVTFNARASASYAPPPRMQPYGKQEKVGDEMHFTFGIMPDERTYEERTFVLGDRDALMQECRKLLVMGDQPYVPPEAWGPEMRRINPVRIYTVYHHVLLCMGGTLEYNIKPRPTGKGSIYGTRDHQMISMPF